MAKDPPDEIPAIYNDFDQDNASEGVAEMAGKYAIQQDVVVKFHSEVQSLNRKRSRTGRIDP
ncbi:MAG: hypothetical protein OXC05_15345 [Halieaceae bacterium]|nr:hypothetical protein [Halieaceae bacterium]